MPRPNIDFDECSGCGACAEACPCNVLEMGDTHVEIVNEDDCSACETCVEECPKGIIDGIDQD